MEPLNSYEVSYVIKTFRPNYKVGMSFVELNRIIGKDRIKELVLWGNYNFNRNWFLDHK